MSYPIGTQKANNIFVRCWHCGDSNRTPHKGHMSVHTLSLVYHCFRCHSSGKLSLSDYLKYVQPHSKDSTEIEVAFEEQALQSTIPKRHTLLQTFETDVHYVWHMRSIGGEITGQHYRHKEHKSIANVGRWGLGYVGARLVSTGYITVVEGPYDVTQVDRVCTFGLITAKKVQSLRWYNLHLIPDGDVWHKPHLTRIFFDTVKYLTEQQKYTTLVTVLENGVDPDSFLPQSRKPIDVRTAYEYCSTLLNRTGQ